jgi:hypothetical protein
MKRLTSRHRHQLVEILLRVERNTRGFDPGSNHGINHRHIREALDVLGVTPPTDSGRPRAGYT